jgi:hypothetical protein
MDPRAKIAYLLVLGVAIFAIPAPDPTWGTAGIVGLAIIQPALAAAFGVPQVTIWRAARKLGPLLAILAASYALSTEGLLAGVLMALRILAVIWASTLVQHSGQPGELVRGLRGLGMPRTPAIALDIALTLIGPGPGRGSGRGLGRRHGGRRFPEASGGAGSGAGHYSDRATSLAQILRGDLTLILQPLSRYVARAEEMAPAGARDVGIIAALAAWSQTIRFVRILPGIPFAPGHKSVVLLPLYVVAAARTRGSWGATALGTTNGMLAFSFGDGQFGPFEILKFIAPGLAVDLLWPLARGRGAVAYAVVGLAAAVARFATIAAVGILVQAPAIFWAALAPIGVFHLVFGAASGFVTYHLLKATWPGSSEETASTAPTSKPT